MTGRQGWCAVLDVRPHGQSPVSSARGPAPLPPRGPGGVAGRRSRGELLGGALGARPGAHPGAGDCSRPPSSCPRPRVLAWPKRRGAGGRAGERLLQAGRWHRDPAAPRWVRAPLGWSLGALQLRLRGPAAELRPSPWGCGAGPAASVLGRSLPGLLGSLLFSLPPPSLFPVAAGRLRKGQAQGGAATRSRPRAPRPPGEGVGPPRPAVLSPWVLGLGLGGLRPPETPPRRLPGPRRFGCRQPPGRALAGESPRVSPGEALIPRSFPGLIRSDCRVGLV